MSSSVVAFKNQHYAELKRDCIERRKLFKDPEFPASNASVFYEEAPRGDVEWKRPGDISSDPHLFVEGINSHDLYQGEVGNCWFVAASSCLALKPNIWTKVIPDWEEQDWDPKHPENYAGIFHFRFWVFGQWTDVVVDDRLPTIDGKLIYCHSNSKREFWSALLEKAYAKLYGCYESLRGGYTGDAVVDFSGAIFEVITLEKEISDKDQINLFEKLRKVNSRGGIVSCGITADPNITEAKLDNGLVRGHAYAVTAIQRVNISQGQGAHSQTETIPMIRMRNPWGEKEWNGPWSDSSREWSKISAEERHNLGLTVEDDGEFWMSFRDWCTHFSDADVCHIADPSHTWNETLHFGKWFRHEDPYINRSGGRKKNETLVQNPQYLFDVTKEMDEVLITLQQKDQRIYKKTGREKNLVIGFRVFKVEMDREHRMQNLLFKKQVGETVFSSARSVFLRCNLPRGRYIVIPSTYYPGEEGEFMLRIFTDVDSSFRELTKDKPREQCWTPFFGCGKGIW